MPEPYPSRQGHHPATKPDRVERDCQLELTETTSQRVGSKVVMSEIFFM